MTASEAGALSAADLASAVRAGRTTAIDAVRASQAHAAQTDAGPQGLNAVLWTDDAGAVHGQLVFGPSPDDGLAAVVEDH